MSTADDLPAAWQELLAAMGPDERGPLLTEMLGRMLPDERAALLEAFAAAPP